MLDSTIQISTDRFDGPLGLLLMLVQKDEVDIKRLDLMSITKQYLAYLDRMKNLNFDVAGEFLYLAATLLHLKSQSCLSSEERERLKDSLGVDELHILSESDLINRLEELAHFQKMGEKLWGLPKQGYETFTKPKINRKTITNSILTPMDLTDLLNVMMDYMKREKRKFTVVKKDRFSIKDKLEFFKSYLDVGAEIEFENLLAADGEEGNDNVVITFISLLELARLHKVKIFQNEDQSKIYINVVNSLDDFDVSAADGFEDENLAEEENSIQTEDLVALDNQQSEQETVQ